MLDLSDVHRVIVVLRIPLGIARAVDKAVGLDRVGVELAANENELRLIERNALPYLDGRKSDLGNLIAVAPALSTQHTERALMLGTVKRSSRSMNSLV